MANGNRNNPPKDDICSGFVSIEGVRLGFILVDTNNLKVCAADIGNAFLYRKTYEKVYIIAGPKFSPKLQEKPLIINKGSEFTTSDYYLPDSMNTSLPS